jgi:hypothetical protein
MTEVPRAFETDATILVRWLRRDQGGRSKPPQTGAGDPFVYGATAIFLSNDHVISDERLSVAIRFSGAPMTSGIDYVAEASFMRPDLAAPHLRTDAMLAICEGPRRVATARVIAI